MAVLTFDSVVKLLQKNSQKVYNCLGRFKPFKMFKDLLLHFHTNLLLVLPCDAALKENLKMNYGACFSSAFS